jgi:hypothetical protein
VITASIDDDIDAAGWPTTAACPAFGYTAHEDATVLRRLAGVETPHGVDDGMRHIRIALGRDIRLEKHRI